MTAAHPSLPPLLFADTATSADQLYFSRVAVHDPFIAFGVGDRRITVQSALEFGRVKKASVFDEVLSLEEWRARAAKRWPRKHVGPAEIIAELAKAYRVRGFRVAEDFPTKLYLSLRALHVRLEVVDGPLFPERETKSSKETATIKQGNGLCSVVFIVAQRIL